MVLSRLLAALSLGVLAACAQPNAASPDVSEPAPETWLKLDQGDGKGDGQGESAAPAQLCPSGGVDQHLALTSAYWVASRAFGNHYAATQGGLNAVHVATDALAELADDGPRLIVDVLEYLFVIPGQLHPEIEARLDTLQALLAGKESRVLAFYVYDEPYLDSHVTPRQTLEQGIARLKARYPHIPTYITFAHHCFDPSAPSDKACTKLPASQRGIPANLDWAAFDWYSDDRCAKGVFANFDCAVVGGVERLKALTSARILLVPEALDLHINEARALQSIHLSYGFALSEPRIFGLDYFLWPTVPDQFRGLAEMPLLRSTVRALNRPILQACGMPDDGWVPVFEWWRSSVNERDYRAGYWKEWRAAGYDPQGVSFGLRAKAEPGTVPLYRCDLDQGSLTDAGFLTTSASCEGAAMRGQPTVIGHIATSQLPGTQPLYRYSASAKPWDHYYSTRTPGPPGYSAEGTVGYVLPGAAF